MMSEQIIPHPYTYLPARAVKENDTVRWFDIDSGKELPPFFGYGTEAQKMVDNWCEKNFGLETHND